VAADETKPFDYAQDVTKQLLTLSTGVITITVAFLDNIAAGAPEDARVALYIAWGMFALTIVCGIFTLLNLTGRVGAAASPQSAGIDATAIRAFAIAQVALFVLAIVATIYFGARAFDPTPKRCTTTVTTTSAGAHGASTKTMTVRPC